MKPIIQSVMMSHTGGCVCVCACVLVCGKAPSIPTAELWQEVMCFCLGCVCMVWLKVKVHIFVCRRLLTKLFFFSTPFIIFDIFNLYSEAFILKNCQTWRAADKIFELKRWSRLWVKFPLAFRVGLNHVSSVIVLVLNRALKVCLPCDLMVETYLRPSAGLTEHVQTGCERQNPSDDTFLFVSSSSGHVSREECWREGGADSSPAGGTLTGHAPVRGPTHYPTLSPTSQPLASRWPRCLPRYTPTAAFSPALWLAKIIRV